MSKCKKCKAPILWCRTATSGSWIPIDKTPNPEGNITISGHLMIAKVVDLFTEADAVRYMPHHATCPNVEEFR